MCAVNSDNVTCQYRLWNSRANVKNTRRRIIFYLCFARNASTDCNEKHVENVQDMSLAGTEILLLLLLLLLLGLFLCVCAVFSLF